MTLYEHEFLEGELSFCISSDPWCILMTSFVTDFFFTLRVVRPLWVLKLLWNGSSVRSSPPYCEVHPSVTDNGKRKKFRMGTCIALVVDLILRCGRCTGKGREMNMSLQSWVYPDEMIGEVLHHSPETSLLFSRSNCDYNNYEIKKKKNIHMDELFTIRA